ncbi:MAG: hypothetical protein HOO96_15005 [Polyangiaceae bacterium]|jgi:hypothetical protein|nr:hypothetical protein [Polyangiaceae bacterium]
MTREEFDEVLKAFQIKSDGDGLFVAPKESTVTLHAAHGGGGMSVTRVEAIRISGGLLFARTTKKETFAIGIASVYALGIDGGNAESARKPAGFG